jgi:biotin carboxylase
VAAGLDAVLAATSHVPELSVEEFVEGEEFTYDTITINGRPMWENVAQYLPRPLEARSREELSPIIITVRDMDAAKYRGGIELGRGVLAALGMGTGFTHMEWYLKSDGEVVFGEIGCRPGGAHLVDQMNYTADIDLFREWARAVCWRTFAAETTRKYNCAIVFKRAQGEGRILRVEGLEEFLGRHGEWVCTEQLLEPGQRRRNWKQTLLSDGFLILRHPDWDTARALAEEAAATIRMFAE